MPKYNPSKIGKKIKKIQKGSKARKQTMTMKKRKPPTKKKR